MTRRSYTIILSGLLLTLFAVGFTSVVFAADAEPAPQEQLKDTLQNAPATKNAKDVTRSYENVPEAYLKEADKFYNLCSITASMYQYYNCKCLAMKFLDTRIDYGPNYGDDVIALRIEKECPDATIASGYEYEQCVAHPNLVSPGNIPTEDYCTCVANTYAKLYEQMGEGPSSSTFVHLKSRAYVMCQDPELEAQLYPRKKLQQ